MQDESNTNVSCQSFENHHSIVLLYIHCKIDIIKIKK